MASALEQLPNEVLAMIAGSLDKHSLTKLLCCSKHIHALGFPQLYRDVTFEPGNLKNLLNFTSTVLEKPSFASRVKSFKIRFVGTTIEERHGLTSREEIPRPLVRAIRTEQHSQQEGDAWMGELMKTENEDAVLALLLPKLSGVRWLDVDWDSERVAMGYCTRALRSTVAHNLSCDPKACDSPLLLGQLKHFLNTFGGDADSDRDYGISSEDAALIFQLPSLKSFIATIRLPVEIEELSHTSTETHSRVTAPEQPIMSLRALVPGSSKVAYLELRGANMFLEDLAGMIKACSSLQTLMFEWVAEDGDVVSNMTKLGRVIRPARSTLRVLCLEYWIQEEDDILEAKALAPLSEFQELSRLTLGMLHAFGPAVADPNDADEVDHSTTSCVASLQNIVPQTVRILSLAVIDVEAEYYPLLRTIREFVGRKEEQWPQLHTIDIVLRVYSPDSMAVWLFRDFGATERRCREVGISLKKRVIGCDFARTMLWGVERKPKSELHLGMLVDPDVF